MFQLNKTANLVTVPPEARLSELKQFLSREGLYFGYHPLTESDETIDHSLRRRTPNLYHFKFGSLADLVSSATVELKSGVHFRLKDAPRAAIGPDFNRLVIGSDGRFGSFHDVTLRLTPLPERVRCAVVALPDAQAAQRAIRRLIGCFVKPLLFKHFDAEAARRGLHAGGTSGKDALLVCLAGLDEMVRVEEEILASYCAESGHDVRWLDIAESQDLMNRHIFKNTGYEEIRRQYREFLWTPSDDSHQAMVTKKFFDHV